MTREFSRNIKSKGIIISETTSWGWHGIKQSSGTHNTKKSLLTRGARVLGEYSVEVAGQTVNLLPLWFGWFDSIFSHCPSLSVVGNRRNMSVFFTANNFIGSNPVGAIM